MNDLQIAEHFDHIDIFITPKIGVLATPVPEYNYWEARCGTRYQHRNGGPDNFYGYGRSIEDAVHAVLIALQADIRNCHCSVKLPDTEP